MKCSICGSHKAGKNKLCWQHDGGRRSKHGIGSPIFVIEKRKTNLAKKIIEGMI
jgi:hypothetical protein